MGENGRRERRKEARKERKQTVERGEREEELDRGLATSTSHILLASRSLSREFSKIKASPPPSQPEDPCGKP